MGGEVFKLVESWLRAELEGRRVDCAEDRAWVWSLIRLPHEMDEGDVAGELFDWVKGRLVMSGVPEGPVLDAVLRDLADYWDELEVMVDRWWRWEWKLPVCCEAGTIHCGGILHCG